MHTFDTLTSGPIHRPAGGADDIVASLSRLRRAAARLRRWLAPLADRWHAAAERHARRRFLRHTRLALQALPAHTLRDLGLDRSEIPSIAGEAAGECDATRARVAQTLGGLRF